MARRAWAVWQQRMRRYKRSGLTVARFCDKEGVSAPSFYQWRKRFGSPPVLTPRQQAAPVFKQLTLARG